MRSVEYNCTFTGLSYRLDHSEMFLVENQGRRRRVGMMMTGQGSTVVAPQHWQHQDWPLALECCRHWGLDTVTLAMHDLCGYQIRAMTLPS